VTKFWYSYILFIIVIGGIFVLFGYITRPVSNGIISPSNKIQWEVGRAKDLSAPLYSMKVVILYSILRTKKDLPLFRDLFHDN